MDHPPPFRRSRSLVASALKARSPRLRPVSPYLRVPYLSGVRRYTKWSDFCTPPPLSPSHSRNLSVLSSSFPSPSPSVRTSYKDGPKGTGCAYGRWSPWSVVNERARRARGGSCATFKTAGPHPTRFPYARGNLELREPHLFLHIPQMTLFVACLTCFLFSFLNYVYHECNISVIQETM